MPLPQQVDAILGMEFFNQYHVWLNPEHKRLLIVDTDASTFDVLTSILNDAENDDANIHMDSATRAHFKKKKKKSAPSSHDKRSEVPHGKIHTSKDGLSEGYHVPQKMLQHMCTLMDKNLLNHEVLDHLLNGHLGKLNLKEDYERNFCGQTFTAKWHGGTESLLVMEAQAMALGSNGTNAFWMRAQGLPYRNPYFEMRAEPLSGSGGYCGPGPDHPPYTPQIPGGTPARPIRRVLVC
eukprot:SAG31_NODE_1554_length_7897_cov_13.662221_1_plen_237_part_00